MSYSRWGASIWYTYRNGNNNFEIMHPKYKCVAISYEIAKELTTPEKLRTLMTLVDERYKNVSLEDYQELLEYLQEYVDDYKNGFPLRL